MEAAEDIASRGLPFPFSEKARREWEPTKARSSASSHFRNKCPGLSNFATIANTFSCRLSIAASRTMKWKSAIQVALRSDSWNPPIDKPLGLRTGQVRGSMGRSAALSAPARDSGAERERFGDPAGDIVRRVRYRETADQPLVCGTRTKR